MSRSIVKGLLAVAVAMTTALTAGCRAAQDPPRPGPEPDPVTSPTVAPAGGPVPFRIRLEAGQRLIPRSSGRDGCPGYDTAVYLGSARTVRLTAYATTCPTGDGQLINGHHGVYRTTADIPADRRAGAVTVPTPLGEATVFTQPYSEYTNSANHYTEPVAVITLAHPADAAYQALTVVAEKGTLPLEQLTKVLQEQLLAP
ncbi:hypothetical protein OHA72_42715 [Dactylosporangium sp. NBC_01737]|uniref:hypothetical protein n=1 Tax=Dactylosporangium sp. NBC_01737 TaxID=2975959 RepID=UPI002E150371|nr:hypothetical protein OHA72_42715 [Dactylosporangium sp. NBC_01737]